MNAASPGKSEKETNNLPAPAGKETVVADPWEDLKKFTSARIALGSTGVSVPVREVLRFRLAHAHARDAVFSELAENKILSGLGVLGLSGIALNSMARDRTEYLQRPDRGRMLQEGSLETLRAAGPSTAELAIIFADGLSAEAVNGHALPLLGMLLPGLYSMKLRVGTVAIVRQGRVAIGDEIGETLNAKLSLLFIGERPGLSSPDSLGAYITFSPRRGLTDEKRNCISNIRPEGLDYTAAAAKILYLIGEAFRIGLTGIGLKDQSASLPL